MKPTIILVVLMLVLFSCAPCLHLAEFATGRYIDFSQVVDSVISWFQPDTTAAAPEDVEADAVKPYPTYTALPTYTPYPTYTPAEQDAAQEKSSDGEDDDSNTITIVANTSTPKSPPTRIVVYPTLCPQYYIGTPCP